MIVTVSPEQAQYVAALLQQAQQAQQAFSQAVTLLALGRVSHGAVFQHVNPETGELVFTDPVIAEVTDGA